MASLLDSFINRSHVAYFSMEIALDPRVHESAISLIPDPARRGSAPPVTAQRGGGGERPSGMGTADPRDLRQGLDRARPRRLVLSGRFRRLEAQVSRAVPLFDRCARVADPGAGVLRVP